MGRPLSTKFVGKNAVYQIQAAVWGENDTKATPGYFSGQTSARRFRTTTTNGTSVTVLADGIANLAIGHSSVNVYPSFSQPSQEAIVIGTRKAVSASIINGGSNYTANSYISLVGGSATNGANIEITSIGEGGDITAISIMSGTQGYDTLPANVSGIAVNGDGIGALLSVDFGIEGLQITNGGSGYTGTSANIVVAGASTQPTITQPTVTDGVVATGNLTITNPGIVNTETLTVSVENETGNVEYAKVLNNSYLTTFQGNHYRWFAQGEPVPASYYAEGVKVAFLDTK